MVRHTHVWSVSLYIAAIHYCQHLFSSTPITDREQQAPLSWEQANNMSHDQDAPKGVSDPVPCCAH